MDHHVEFIIPILEILEIEVSRILEVVEIRFCIVPYVHGLFDKSSENSHFSTLTHLAESLRNHDISSEMIALGLS